MAKATPQQLETLEADLKYIAEIDVDRVPSSFT